MKRIVTVGKFIKGKMYKVIDLSVYRSKNQKYPVDAEANVSVKANEHKTQGKSKE